MDGTPAIVDFDEAGQVEIVSPRLSDVPVRIEIVDQEPGPIRPDDRNALAVERLGLESDIAAATQPDQVALIASLKPSVDQIVYVAPFELSVPHRRVDENGELWRVSVDLNEAQRGSTERVVVPTNTNVESDGAIDPRDQASLTQTSPMQTWRFAAIPSTATQLILQRDLSSASAVTIDRACVRSFVGNRTRQEQLIANVTGENVIRIGLPGGLPTMSVEARLDGREIEIRRDASSLRVDLRPTNRRPSATATHVLDIRVWLPWNDNAWWLRVEPLMKLPLGSGQLVWELIVPSDRHLVWASSTSGRAMRWQRDRLRMARTPIVSDDELVKWASGARRPLPGIFSAIDGVIDAVNAASDPPFAEDALNAIPGNRYLFYAGDTFAFAGGVVSRTWLWLMIGVAVLALAAALNLEARLWHPLTAIAIALIMTGLMVVAPDAVILAGQLAAFAMILVVVLYSIASLLGPQSQQRALTPSRRTTETIRPHADSRSRVGASRPSSVREITDPSDASQEFSLERAEDVGSASKPSRQRETVLVATPGAEEDRGSPEDSKRPIEAEVGLVETHSIPGERAAKRDPATDSNDVTASGSGTT